MGPYPTMGQTPRPITLVDRLRQNGRTDRDDSPLRKLFRSDAKLISRTFLSNAIPTGSRVSITDRQSRRYASCRIPTRPNEKSESRSRTCVISDNKWICQTRSKAVLMRRGDLKKNEGDARCKYSSDMIVYILRLWNA